MSSRFLKFSVICLLLVGAAVGASAQPDPIPDATTRSGRPARMDRPFGFEEMLAKQRAARAKKDHEEMLERGEQALRLANQLEASFAQNNSFSDQDKARLQSLEKVVLKIREELGGDDDGSVDTSPIKPADDDAKPSTMEEAFRFLKSTTVKLVDELKRTSRFSISAIAIQSSNNVLKLVKFLRLRK